MKTDQDLQLMLARKLPERIQSCESYNQDGSTAYFWFIACGINFDNVLPIRPTEWLKIVQDVEETLLTHQWNPYLVKLWHVTCDREGQKPSCDYGSPLCMLAMTKSKWNTRATVLYEIGVI